MSSSPERTLTWRYHLREHQREVYKRLKRFNVLLAHRRFGKTVLAVMVLIRKALECPLERPQCHYYSPTYSQSKKIAWEYVKQYTQGTDTVYNESELKATLPNGAIIQLGSGDNPDASRGIYSDYAVLDEPSQMSSKLLTEVLRPALSDRKGGMLMIGTPKGRHGLFYDSYQQADHLDDWWRGMYKASETGIIDPAELTAASRTMSRAEYQQEFECSFSAALKGAYYGEVMDKLESAGRLTHISHDVTAPVYLGFDLGVNDSTAIWFYQLVGNDYRFIDYQEYQNTGLPDMVKDLKKRDYTYGQWVLPFDVQNMSLSTGETRLHTLQQLGVDAIVAPKTDLIDGIEATRSMLERCWFDKDKCRHGIEALRQYRSEWDDIKGVLRLRPIHDWSSHGADAMRYIAVAGTDVLTLSWGGPLDYSQLDQGMQT